MDVIYIALIAVLIALALGFVDLCARLRRIAE